MLLPSILVAGATLLAQSAPDPLSGEALFEDVARYASIPIHQTATPGDRLTSRWLALELREAGYDTLEVEWPLRQYTPAQHGLEIDGESLTTFPIWLPPDGEHDITAPLIDGSDGIDGDVAGKIVVMNSTVITRERWSTGVNDFVNQAAQHGARAIVFVLNTPSAEIAAINARKPHHQRPLPIPALLVRATHEATLLDAVERGESARLYLNGSIEPTAAVNVVASIDRGKPWLVVTTPTSGWFSCAGERGPGVALFLGLARWLAREDFPYSLRFIGNSGHELDNIGAHYSLDDYGPPPEDVACWIHLGASIATRAWDAETDQPLPEYNDALNIVSTPELLPIITEAFQNVSAYNPRAEGPVLGELRHFMNSGYRAWGFFGGHHYFHTPLDTEVCTAPELLEPVGQSLKNVIRALSDN